MRSICYLVILVSSFPIAFGQPFKSKESRVHFYSDAPMEDIEATNSAGSSVMDLSTGSIVFSIPIDQFQFAKALMQTHFNENYMESHKYPKAMFLGKMHTTELKDGINTVTVTGEMEIHGVKRKMTATGIMTKIGNNIQAHSEFSVLLKDYAIKIPKAVFYNIAEEIAVTVDFTYEQTN